MAGRGKGAVFATFGVILVKNHAAEGVSQAGKGVNRMAG
jgi:hypothetical protein